MKLTALCSALLLSCLSCASARAADVPIPSPPQINAPHYVLMDYATGKLLVNHDGDARAEPASLTKLMTAYVVFHALADGRLKLTDMITISEHAWRAEGSRTFAQVGTQIPAEVLIKGMLVQSGNDATIALAERIGGTEPAFVQLMNEYAKRLGMTGTHFVDSTGLPEPDHYTTAHDIATLSAAIIRDFPQYYPWFSIREFTWNNIRQQNRDGLLERDPSVDGLKTGHTEAAGYCLASSAKRGNTRLVAVVMGADSTKGREDANAALLNYGFTFYETVAVHKRGDTLLNPRVYKGSTKYVNVGVNHDVYVTVPRSNAGNISMSAAVTQPLLAPLDVNKPVGMLAISVNGVQVEAVPLYPLAPVATGGFWRRLTDSVLLWFHNLKAWLHR